jgi:photosystem II stability/assembly factor-like uncharacterized protein
MKALSLLIFLCVIIIPVKSQWQEEISPTTNPLYAISIVDNATAWICGRYGTVLKTINGGASWSIEGSGYFQGYVHLFSLYAIDDQTVFVSYHQGGIGDNTRLFKTNDGGQNWSAVFQQTGGWIMDIKMFNEDTGFLYTSPLNQYWRFFNTTNGGSTWIPLSQYPEQFLVESGHYNSTYISGSQIFFGSNSGNIYHSTDTGINWSLIPSLQQNIYSIWFNNSQDGLIGEDNILEMTTDGGSNWSTLTSLNGLDSISAITGTGNDWWVANKNNIYYSNDNRVSWVVQYTAPSGNFTHMSKARNGNLIIAVRDNGGISAYLSPVPVELNSFTATTVNNNVILSWRTASEINNMGFVILRSKFRNKRYGASSAWEDIDFIQGRGTTADENFYTFSDNNLEQGIYSYKLVQLDFDGTRTESGVVNVEVKSQVKTYSLEQNYPNPFNPSTTIKFALPVDSKVKINVYNSLGQLVETLVEGEMQSGYHQINFDGSELASGVYIYQLQAGEYTLAKKMLLMK